VTAASFADFVRAHTVAAAPPLVPEIRLHLASEVMTLWGATESLGAVHSVGLTELPPPYWAFAWPGGQALARYLLDRPDDIAGKHVLDFGAGSGLVAIAAMKAGAASAQAADIDALARASIALNAAANAVAVEAIADDIIGADARWGAVLVGDMCYERALAERLVPWLRSLARASVLVLIGDPGRNYFSAEGLTKRATYSVPTSRDLEDREIRETSVYALNP
jgi:predicted nicotinamide N-methyase